MDNLFKKIGFQEDENQHLKTQIDEMTESWNRMQSKVQSDK